MEEYQPLEEVRPVNFDSITTALMPLLPVFPPPLDLSTVALSLLPGLLARHETLAFGFFFRLYLIEPKEPWRCRQ